MLSQTMDEEKRPVTRYDVDKVALEALQGTFMSVTVLGVTHLRASSLMRQRFVIVTQTVRGFDRSIHLKQPTALLGLVVPPKHSDMMPATSLMTGKVTTLDKLRKAFADKEEWAQSQITPLIHKPYDRLNRRDLGCFVPRVQAIRHFAHLRANPKNW